MDQEAWNQIYNDLERDIEALKTRGGAVDEMAVIMEIDRARFAMERGDNDEAIYLIQAVKRQLREPGGAITRGGGASPAEDRLNALEDNLHSTTRLGSARLEIVGEEEEEPTRAASQNTKVNKSIKLDDIKDEYLKLWSSCRIRQDKAASVRREAERLLANRQVYEEISAETSVPWWFIGLIHQMECSYSLNKHLHNGDSLKARTWQVPPGRPKEGSPPFEFVESAIDALEVDGFAGKTDWPLPTVLWRLERYNGFGYRKKFGFASPYLWSYTNHFSSGKYVKDGVFDSNAVSKQCGTSATLRDLMERGIVSFEEKKPDPVVAVAPKPEPVGAPAATPTPKPAPADAPYSSPSSAPSPVVATVPAAPAAPAVVPDAAQPIAAPAPTPAPIASPPGLAAASDDGQVLAQTPAPVSAPVSAQAPPAVSATPAAAQPTQPKPEVLPVAPQPAASQPATPTPPATAAAPGEAQPAAATSTLGDSVSPAVAAALAELAKRAK